MPNSTICLSFDFDAMSVWFSYPNTTPAMLSRGEYGARVGVPQQAPGNRHARSAAQRDGQPGRAK